MKIRRFLTILLTIICILAFVACSANKGNDPNAGEDPGTNDGQNNNTPTEEAVIFDINTDISVVCGEDASSDRAAEIYEALVAKTKSVKLIGPDSKAAQHEIIVGKANRALSEKAYDALARYKDGHDDYIGWCICSDGKSVAIAFDGEIYGSSMAQDEAIDLILTKYLSGDALVLEEGITDYDAYEPIAHQEEIDQAESEKKWEALSISLEKKYGSKSEEMVKALNELHTLYTDELVDWFANLYDPETGGFYYSNSARNSYGYLPDLESTNQTLGFLIASGITDNIAEFIPEEMQKKMVAFVKAMQSPEDGHFYHPQWGVELTSKYPARLGRDASNATRILDYFGAKPTYDAPNGVKGENPIGSSPASSLTERIPTSTVSAVSKVLLTNNSDAGVKSYLLNDEKFREFLAGYDERIKTDAYWVGNELESIASQVVARDKVLAERGEKYSLCKIATDWLTSHIDPETGLWEPYEGNEYDCVNGILKISSAYSKMGYPVPGALELIDYAARAVTSDADPHHVCCVLNPWYALSVLTTNLTTHSPTAKEDLDEFRSRYIDSYVEMVNATRAKFALFVKGEGTSAGAFSYFQNETSPGSQGMPVALDGANEGDVNSSYICSAGVAGHIWGFIGESAISLYTPSDGMRFIKIVESLGPIIKDEEVEAVPIDFEDVDEVSELVGGVMDSWIPSGELVVEQGAPYGESSRVLRLTTTSKNDLFQLNITKPQGIFNAVAFESDVMFAPVGTSTYELLMFGKSQETKHVNVMLQAVPGDGVYVYSADFNKIKIAEDGKWFNLRVEYGRVNNVTVEVDIIVDNRLVASCSSPYGNEALPADSLARIQFSAYHGATSNGSAYFDNMFLEQISKDIDTLPDVEVGPLEEDTGILVFDRKPYNTYVNQKYISDYIPKGSIGIVDGEPYGWTSKVLALQTPYKGGDLFQLMTTKKQESFNAIAFETDIRISASDSSVFEILVFGTTSNRGCHVMLSTDADNVYIYSDGIDKVKIASQDQWFKLKIVYTKVSERRICCEMFVDGKSVAIDTTPYNVDNVPTPKDIYRIQFAPYHAAAAEGTVYFDNMSVMQVEYTLPELPEEEEPTGPSESETGILTFDERPLQGYITAGLLDQYFENGSLKIIDGKNHGWDSSVLELTSNGSGSNLIQLKVTKTAEQANALAFETDIMFLASAPSVYELLVFGSQSSLKGANLLFSANDDGVFVSAEDVELTRVSSLNQHFRLKVVYTKVDDSRVCVEVFVNGISVAISTAPYGDTVYAAGDMTRIQFSSYHASAATGSVYFDNTSLMRVEYTLPELPENTVPDPEPDPTPDPEPEPDPDPIIPTPNPNPTPDPDGTGPFDEDDSAADDWTEI